MNNKTHKVTIFLPCRAGSMRIPNKNTRVFSNDGLSLFQIKIKQLIKCNYINSIVVSTDDTDIISQLNDYIDDKKIIVHHRDSGLCTSSTTTDELIKLVPNVVNDEHILWTHVTSPFVDSKLYDRMIVDYFSSLSDFDSLMSVNKIKKFIWDETKPINYDRSEVKWPFTQSIRSLYEINSACFITSRANYIKHEDRIGVNPKLYNLSCKDSFDIDYMDDLDLAAHIYNSK